MRSATILLFLCAVQGCGQKGPLTLPPAQTQIPSAQSPDPQSPVAPSPQQSQ
ncbi:MAG: lipoprotein [Gallionella sp.]